MQGKTKYKTRQRELLLEFLERNAGEHITAREICEHFKETDPPIGKSTVYRQLETLVDEGILNKYSVDGSSAACFEYVPSESHGEGVCFHCKCEKCGALIHLHCDELQAVQLHLFEEHQFRVDSHRTVFYGICEQCGP